MTDRDRALPQVESLRERPQRNGRVQSRPRSWRVSRTRWVSYTKRRQRPPAAATRSR